MPVAVLLSGELKQDYGGDNKDLARWVPGSMCPANQQPWHVGGGAMRLFIFFQIPSEGL